MALFNKTTIRAARKKELRKLGTLLKESKNISLLSESKREKVKTVYISEINKLVFNYASLLLLEFIEKDVADLGRVLHNILNMNRENEIGRYLSSLEVMKKVPGTKGNVDVFTRIEQISTEEGKISAVKPTVHAGYSTRLSPTDMGPGAGTFKALEEGLIDAIKGVFKGKKQEPYQPKPSQLMDPKTGKIVGTFSPTEKTAKGNLADLSREREELTNLVLRDEPKLVQFTIAYLRFFGEDNLGSDIKKAKEKILDEPNLQKFVKKEFGKIAGFNSAEFAKQIGNDLNIVDFNLRLTKNKKYLDTLTRVDQVTKGLLAKMKKGLGATIADFFGGAAYYPGRPARG